MLTCRKWTETVSRNGLEYAVGLTLSPSSGCTHSILIPHGNDKTNGLRRHYLRKRTDLRKYSQADLKRIQESLNDTRDSRKNPRVSHAGGETCRARLR
jgi:hypothetical protein